MTPRLCTAQQVVRRDHLKRPSFSLSQGPSPPLHSFQLSKFLNFKKVSIPSEYERTCINTLALRRELGDPSLVEPLTRSGLIKAV